MLIIKLIILSTSKNDLKFYDTTIKGLKLIYLLTTKSSNTKKTQDFVFDFVLKLKLKQKVKLKWKTKTKINK